MTPILLLSDGPLAAGLLARLERRAAVSTSAVMALDVLPGPAGAQRAALSAVIQQMDPDRRGTLVLVEQDGLRCANLAIGLLDRHPLAIVTGLNAPMLQGVLEARSTNPPLEAGTTEPPLDLADLADVARIAGRNGISRISG